MTDTTKFLTVGKIVAAHGVRGEVKALSYTEEPKTLATLPGLMDAKGRALKVVYRGIVKDALILKIDGVDDRNAAEAMKGTLLQVLRTALPALPEASEEFYLEDLVGLEVRSEGAVIGRVASVQNYGASDILEIAREGQSATEMFAFTEANFPELDIEAGWILLSVPEEI